MLSGENAETTYDTIAVKYIKALGKKFNTLEVITADTESHIVYMHHKVKLQCI